MWLGHLLGEEFVKANSIVTSPAMKNAAFHLHFHEVLLFLGQCMKQDHSDPVHQIYHMDVAGLTKEIDHSIFWRKQLPPVPCITGRPYDCLFVHTPHSCHSEEWPAPVFQWDCAPWWHYIQGGWKWNWLAPCHPWPPRLPCLCEEERQFSYNKSRHV